MQQHMLDFDITLGSGIVPIAEAHNLNLASGIWLVK